MTPLRRGGAIVAFVLVVTAPAWSDETDRFAAARERFRAAVALAYDVGVDQVVVEPAAPAASGTDLDRLAVGEFRAFRASFTGRGGSVTGFASVADEPPAFVRFQYLGAGGIASLLRELEILDPAGAYPLSEMVPRIAWAYAEYGKPLTGPGLDWSLDHTDTGATLVYYSSTVGVAGRANIWCVTLHVDHQYRTDVVRTQFQ